MYDDDINKRLDMLQSQIQEKEFLEGEGLGSELNIWIFDYNPKDEMIIRHFTERLAENKALRCRIVKRDLYKIFLSICEDMEIMDGIKEIEEDSGSKYLLKKLYGSIEVQDFIKKIQYPDHKTGDVLILNEVGDVFPFMRVHTLLSAMQKDFSDIPIVVLYPGTYNKMSLALFDKLPPNDYYRAFRMIGEDAK